MKFAKYFSIAPVTVLILSGCASQPVVLAPVGPAPPASSATYPSLGYLQVFSATETHADGDNTYYYPHKGYCIMSDAGKMLHYVDNHVGTMDQTPSVVSVPAGHYQIIADAEGYGRVTVPVVIQGGRTTTIHLELDWKPVPGIAGNLVRLPGGEAIGWSASSN